MDNQNLNDNKSFHMYKSDWNSSVERNIKDIGESCGGYSWMHINSATRDATIFSVLMYLTIIFPPLSALFATIQLMTENEIFFIFVLIIGFTSSVVSAIVKFGKYQEKSTNHKSSAAQYASLGSNIRNQLSLYRKNRMDAGRYLQWVSKSFENLFVSSPLVDSGIYNEWIRIAKNNKLCVPKEYGSMTEIHTSVDFTGINVNSLEHSPRRDQDHHSVHISPPVPPTSPRIPISSGKNIKSTPADLNRYDEEHMKYELSRLYGN